jgi:hypothetical protein
MSCSTSPADSRRGLRSDPGDRGTRRSVLSSRVPASRRTGAAGGQRRRASRRPSPRARQPARSRRSAPRLPSRGVSMCAVRRLAGEVGELPPVTTRFSGASSACLRTKVRGRKDVGRWPTSDRAVIPSQHRDRPPRAHALGSDRPRTRRPGLTGFAQPYVPERDRQPSSQGATASAKSA